MVVDFKCVICGNIRDTQYYPTYNHFLEEKDAVVCECGGKMERMDAAPHYNPFGENIPGYEKENKDHRTFGASCDAFKSKWV